jgi:hypothetical protein
VKIFQKSALALNAALCMPQNASPFAAWTSEYSPVLSAVGGALVARRHRGRRTQSEFVSIGARRERSR